MNTLRTELQRLLVEAKPLDRESTLDDPKGVAEYAAKRVGYYGYGSGQLLAQASHVENAQQAAKVLIDCLAALPRPSEAELSELLTIEQAAEYLGYSVPGLRKLVAAKRITYVQNGKGGHIKFTVEALDEYIADNSKGPDDIERAPARGYRHPIQSGHGFI